jgi:hypothetical protein
MARAAYVWTDNLKGELRRRWAAGEDKAVIMAEMGLTRGQFAGATMRLNLQPRLHSAEVAALPPSHPAAIEGRTLFPSRVRSPLRGADVLVRGKDNRKLGDVVTKGPWSGMPIYSLTLEERRTCPRTCHHWLMCYGGSMQFAARNEHGPELERRLAIELDRLSAKHLRTGYAVRLHTLGDFYSVDYVNCWRDWLAEHPRLHVWGYTAWPRDSEIGAAVNRLIRRHWNRFAIRFSGTTVGRGNATTIKLLQDADLTKLPPPSKSGKVIVCPVETGRARSCGSCALCWSDAARHKTIAFILHGNPRPGRPKGAEHGN